jgi:hypothetical protein
MGYEYAGTPGWGYFGGMLGGAGDDVPALMWPSNILVYNRMRTDAQIDALIKSVTLPLRRLNWMIAPNGARDEVVEDISNQLRLPIQGDADEFVVRGRPRFNHDNHLRLALLAPTVFGHMPFEIVGEVDATDLSWKLSKLAARMPQTIAKFNVARDGGLDSIVQYDPTNYNPAPIPISQLVVYTWELEGGNWAGRSMLRPLYKHWLLKDRLLRIDAIKNERFGAGIPVGTAPPGGDPADYQKLASATRASETGGVGLPDGSTLDIMGIRGTLPDTIASIRYQDEAMARSFLAMFLQLGTTETGSRALGESFIDFFQDALWGFVKWYTGITNEYLINDIVDWNWGEDEQAPMLVAVENDERPLGVGDLAALVQSGALVVDAELQSWIRKSLDMPEYKGEPPIVVKAEPGAAEPAAPVAAGGKPSKGTPKDKRLKENKPRVTVEAHAGHDDQSVHGNRYDENGTLIRKTPRPRVEFHGGAPTPPGEGHVRVLGASQTVNTSTVGHRQPTTVEIQAATNFERMQQLWEDATETLVQAWGTVRQEQIDSLVDSIQAAVLAGDEEALANIAAPVLGDDLILTHLKDLAETALVEAAAEAQAQGVALEAVGLVDIEGELATRSQSIARLMANGISQSAAIQALLRFGVGTMSPEEVAQGVRAQLDSLSDAYLNDVLGGALTQAQNTARRAVMATAPVAKIYASELLDENTCTECAGVDHREYGSVDAASSDYPAGGYHRCLGGPRCRGTLVAVYGEGDNQNPPGLPTETEPEPGPEAPPELLGSVASRVPFPQETLDVLVPKGGWTTSTRNKTITELKKTPEGKKLLTTMDSFQSGGSTAIPRLRTDITKYLAGDTEGMAQGRIDTIENFLSAVGHSEAGSRTLWRGMSIPGSMDEVMAKYAVGDDLDIAIGSFSSDKKLAQGFSLKGAGQKVTSSTTTPVLVEWVGETKHALPIQKLSKSLVFAEEKEWVGAGRFTIEGVKKSRNSSGEVLVVTLRQKAVW